MVVREQMHNVEGFSAPLAAQYKKASFHSTHIHKNFILHPLAGAAFDKGCSQPGVLECCWLFSLSLSFRSARRLSLSRSLAESARGEHERERQSNILKFVSPL
jgi:hypothetical protein